jgi:hypothetical protein
MILMATPTNSVMRVAGLVVLSNTVETDKVSKDALSMRLVGHSTLWKPAEAQFSFRHTCARHALFESYRMHYCLCMHVSIRCSNVSILQQRACVFGHFVEFHHSPSILESRG